MEPIPRMASGLQSDPWLLQLPDERLSAVLRCCADDIRSVFSAARAHSRLHKAAALAVSSITAMGLEQEQARSILVYLGIHGQHVDSIDLRSNGHTASLRQLPHNKLQKLSSLNVSRCRLQLQPGYGFQGVLWAGAPLKQLRLESCMLSDNIEQVAAALSLLPELQHLCFDGNQLSNKSRLCFPSSVLQKLQQPTYLELAGNQLEGPDGLQHVHDLTCLQDRRLQLVSGSNIQACWLSGLQKLTQLKFLGSYDFEPSCLAGKTLLQHLYLSVSSARTEQLLSHLQHMHQLTHVVLSLQGSVIAPGAAYSALTASSKLQHLMIYHCQLLAGAWQHMFPAARQLPQLTVLDLSNVCKPDSASPALAPAASSLVSCCPGLQVLRIEHLLCSAEQLPPLTGLSSLSELVLRPAGDSSTALDVVCQLTGLRRLVVTDPASEDSELFLQLTQLQRLTYLQVSTREEGPHWKTTNFYSGAPYGGPVWQQVVNHYNTPRVKARYRDSSDDSVGGDEGSDDWIESDTD